jgi:hypothetical protein
MKKNILLFLSLTVFVSSSMHCLSEQAAERVGAGLVFIIAAGKSAKKLYDNRHSYQNRVKSCGVTALQKFKNSCPIKHILKEFAKNQPRKNSVLNFIEKTGCVFVGTWKASSGCARSLLARLLGSVQQKTEQNSETATPQESVSQQ